MRVQAFIHSVVFLGLLSSLAAARPALAARPLRAGHRITTSHRTPAPQRAERTLARRHNGESGRCGIASRISRNDAPKLLHGRHGRRQSQEPADVDAHPVKLTVGGRRHSVRRRRSQIEVRTPQEDVLSAEVLMPALYTRRGRLIVPPALKGSHEILVHQNTMADREGLDRVQDDADLDAMREARRLVALPASAALEIDDRLPANRRYCRPWTAQFLAALAKAHYQRFHSSLQVNSAVRTVEFQLKLRNVNGNAAPAEGATASPHLTGQAIDLAKHGLTMTEIAWLRAYLLPLVRQGKVDVEEEFQQSCFHVSVYQRYLPQASPDRVIPGQRSAVVLAAAVR